MIFPKRYVPLRSRIPMVFVRLTTDEGDVAFRARWQRRPIDLQRRIIYRLREGRPIWFEDEWGHDLCFPADRVLGAVVDGRDRDAPA